MRNLFILIFLTVFANLTFADGPPVDWQKTFGGSSHDDGRSVKQACDGGFIITGALDWSGDKKALLIKTDTEGNEIWFKTFEKNSNDETHTVQQTKDGGFILAGSTLNGAMSQDFWLIKTDANGNKVWDKTYGGINTEYVYSVQQTNDGGYILIGETFSFGEGNGDVWLVKTDVNGNKLWDRTFGGNELDSVREVLQTSDGGYIIAAYIRSYGSEGSNAWLIKTDTDGNKIWEKVLGGSENEEALAMIQSIDGSYIITGGGANTYIAGDKDIWLAKIQADCVNQPRSDLNGDCKVDIKDIAVISFEWLNCGRHPDMACW